MLAALARAEASSADRVSTAPRACPVVPEVYMMTAASAASVPAARAVAAISAARSASVSFGCSSSTGTRASSSV